MTASESTMRSYAEQDVGTIIAKLNKQGAMPKVSKVGSLDFTYGGGDQEYLDVEAHLEAGGVPFDLLFSYTADGDNIYIEESVDDLCKDAESRYNQAAGVTASTRLEGKKSIMAAEGDEDSENPFAEIDVDDTDGLGDAVDDLGDQVEDLQDAVDEEDEDQDEDGNGIERDNNIAGHYIAECDRCHGVFISAVVESDQVIDKVTGTCPLCDKETDQYLKWVIKDADMKTKQENARM